MKHEIDLADEFATLIATKVVDILEERGLVMATNPSQTEDKRLESEYPILYTIDEVCERLKICKGTLHRHRRMRYIIASHYVGRSPRFTEEDIKKYLDLFHY